MDTSQHTIAKVAVQDVDGFEYLSIHVELACDVAKTPWCKWYVTAIK